MYKKCILIAMLIAAFAPFADAQEYMIAPHAGYQRTLDADEGNFVWGGFIRYKPWTTLGFDLMVDVVEDDFLDGDVTVRSLPISLNVLFYPIPDRFYLSAGGTFFSTEIDYPDPLEDVDETAFGWNAGIGVEIPLMDWLSLTGDARYVFRDIDFDQTLPDLVGADTDFWMVRAGIGVRFGDR